MPWGAAAPPQHLLAQLTLTIPLEPRPHLLWSPDKWASSVLHSTQFSSTSCHTAIMFISVITCLAGICLPQPPS